MLVGIYFSYMNYKSGFSDIFIIIAGLCVTFIVIGMFSGGKSPFASFGSIRTSIQNNQTKTTTTTTTTTPKNESRSFVRTPCGLSIAKPAPLEKITNPVVIRGTVNGCGWLLSNGQAGTVELVDMNYVSLSPRVPLPVVGALILPATFETSLSWVSSSADTGFLVFRNMDSRGKQVQVVNLPVSFK